MKNSLYDFCLASNPQLLDEWNAERNEATPRQLTIGSTKSVWWRCSAGHEWRATIYARVRGNGCPVCAGKVVIPGVNDLASHFPALVEQWSAKNELAPTQVTPYSNKKVWWRCTMGHEWQAVVAARTNMGSRCPYCAGRKVWPGFNDLATKDPKLAAEWHPTLNGELTPEQVTTGSNRKVWWRCALAHEWCATIYSRAKGGCGCPVCAGKRNR